MLYFFCRTYKGWLYTYILIILIEISYGIGYTELLKRCKVLSTGAAFVSLFNVLNFVSNSSPFWLRFGLPEARGTPQMVLLQCTLEPLYWVDYVGESLLDGIEVFMD